MNFSKAEIFTKLLITQVLLTNTLKCHFKYLGQAHKKEIFVQWIFWVHLWLSHLVDVWHDWHETDSSWEKNILLEALSLPLYLLLLIFLKCINRLLGNHISVWPSSSELGSNEQIKKIWKGIKSFFLFFKAPTQNKIKNINKSISWDVTISS